MPAATIDVGPSATQQASAPNTAPTLFLREISRSAKPQMRLVMLAAAGATIGTIAFSAAVALIIGGLAQDQRPPAWIWTFGVVGIAIRLLSNVWRDRLGQKASKHVRRDLRATLLQLASQQGPARLAQQGNAAWWAQLHLEQVDALHGYLAKYLPTRHVVTITPALIIATTFWVDWIAGLLLLLATPIIPVFMVLIGWGTQAVHQTQQAQQAALAAHLLDRLQALPWLRRQGAIEQTEFSIEQAAQDYRRISMRVLRVAFLSSATLEFFSALSIGLMAIYIGFSLLGMLTWIPGGQLTLTQGLFILMLAPECFLPLRQLAQAHHEMNAAKASAESLGFLHLSSEVKPFVEDKPKSAVTVNSPLHGPRRDTAQQHTEQSLLKAHNLALTWPGANRPILTGVSLLVQPGEIVCIAGDSGTGKSTLLALLAGFLSPDEGDLARVGSFAWLNQRPHLFHRSLRDNLLLACIHPVADQALYLALQEAGISLPDPLLPQGLDTPIGEANQGVSGGQAQRIGLCRAILSEAPIWLLDEPTAALDDSTRDALLATIIPYVRRHCIALVLTSHDQAVIAKCDRVLRVDQGSLMQESE